MVALSISIEGWFGLTWSHWKRLVTAVEQLGFAGLFLSDHVLLHESPPQPSLELIASLRFHSLFVRCFLLGEPERAGLEQIPSARTKLCSPPRSSLHPRTFLYSGRPVGSFSTPGSQGVPSVVSEL